MTNIITACFGGTRFTNTRPAWLIDHGMVLQIKGVELPETYEVDFSNSKAETATRVLGNADGVVIPDQYFLSNAPQIFAWVYLTTGDSGFTTLQITIPLSQRPDVSTEPPTPQETDLIEQAIAALNDGVERAETAADNAEQSATEAKETAENIQQTVEDALQEAKESGEFDGKDGVTFTPDVDAAGIISWTNDGGLPNPQTRNIKGPAGKDGEVGATPNLTIGTVETLEPGEDATAEITGTAENPVLNLGIPQGEQGDSADTSNLAPIIINSASGDIASFADGADGLPVKALTVNVEPIQAGTGDPSPDNVRPISGRTSATVTRTGKNLLNLSEWETESNSGVTISTDSISIINKGFQELLNRYNVLNRSACVFSFHVKTVALSGSRASFAVYADGTVKLAGSGTASTGNIELNSVGTEKDITVTVPNGTEYISFGGWAWSGEVQISNLQLELGSTATAYEPYQGNTYTIQLGDTVYGGTLDVTGGKMVVDRAMLTFNTANMNNSEQYPGFKDAGIRELIGGGLSGTVKTGIVTNVGTEFSYNTLELSNDIVYFSVAEYNKTQTEWIALAIDVQILVPLATPIEITLTPTQIDTLLGTNNIWSDAGPVDVDYRADTKLYIDNIHTPTDDDMTADAQISSGKYFLIGGNLYKSTTVIPAGDTIIPGTNCIKTNLAEALNALNT